MSEFIQGMLVGGVLVAGILALGWWVTQSQTTSRGSGDATPQDQTRRKRMGGT